MGGETEVQKNNSDQTYNKIFALDIGTRSVIGMVGEMREEAFHLLEMEIVEHEKRAMLDGQIEDIDQVAKVAGIVKQRLEERLGAPLNRINVAAAGRALKTKSSSFEMEVDRNVVITREIVSQLELGAIEQAARSLEQGQEHFFCAGSSVLNYFLDDYKISTLLDHKGQRIRVEMIVTFLPEEVVNSLYAVVEKLGASVESLTLEPIAALNAIIPKELQMLNLALVDIGAGTSDIAITDKGSVIGYTMATIAGDEVTEAIISAYLVDFETAEQIKIALGQGQEEITFTDILGIDNTIGLDEALAAIQPVTQELSGVISEKILEINSGAPRAVFLVGGGSKAPGLRELVAKGLGMDLSKVAVGGNNYMKKTVISEMNLAAPEFATPVGIAITAAKRKKNGAGAVTVNGESVRIFGDKAMTISETLLAAGYKYNDIIGRMGKRLSCSVNGRRMFFNGKAPTNCTILRNGKAGALEDTVSSGDVIEVTPATHGEDAIATVKDAIKAPCIMAVVLDETQVNVGTVVYINGIAADMDRKIQEGDVIETRLVNTLGSLLEEEGYPTGRTYLVNGEYMTDMAYVLENGDRIELVHESQGKTSVKEEKPIVIQEGIQVNLNGDVLNLPPKQGEEGHIFLDLLNYMDINRDELKNNIILNLNGKEASFLDQLKQDDVIKIEWS